MAHFWELKKPTFNESRFTPDLLPKISLKT